METKPQTSYRSMSEYVLCASYSLGIDEAIKRCIIRQKLHSDEVALLKIEIQKLQQIKKERQIERLLKSIAWIERNPVSSSSVNHNKAHYSC